MSVRPVAFHPDGSIDVVYDELGHSGTLSAAQVVWGANHYYIMLACPDGCGATSSWPVGGGADAVMGQQLFRQKTEREGCTCGNVSATDTDALAESHVCLNVNRMDGPDRWQGASA